MPRGRRRTQYVRDNSGRFASTPGGGPSKSSPAAVRKAAKAATLKGGSLAARTSLKRSKAKMASIDKADQSLKTSLSKRAQKGAVTRSQKAARAAIKSSRKRIEPTSATLKRNRTVKGLLLVGIKRKTKLIKELTAAKEKRQQEKKTAAKVSAAIKKGPVPSKLKSKTAPPPPPPSISKKSNDGEPVLVQKESKAPGYKIPKPPAGYKASESPSKTPSKGRRMEARISTIRTNRLRKDGSPDRQWKAYQTEKRAAEFLRAAARFAERKGISLDQALRSGPKNSTAKSRKKKRNRS
jgi:hypothetical protein